MKQLLGLIGAIIVIGASVPQAFSADWMSPDPRRAKYSDVVSYLEGLAKQFPTSAKTFDLAQSDSGQMIRGIAIGAGPARHLLVATHHGNEYGSTEVARAVAENLASHPIAGATVYLIPVLNIAGYDAKSRWEPAHGDSHDPNRDYAGPCGTEGPHNLKSTAALAKFMESEKVVAVATLHTFYPAVAYPWGLSSTDISTPYDGLFKQLGALAAQESGYPVGNSTELIYPANGTFEDYAYWTTGAWALLFELGQSHSPTVEQIREMARVNVPGIRRFFENAPKERAAKHSFDGKCDDRLRALDRHDE